MKSLRFLTLFALMLSGLSYDASLSRAMEPDAALVKIACVGDSITFGAGVENRAKNAYPRVLGEMLGKEYVVQNFGRSGATLLKKGDLPYWKTPQFKKATAMQPAIVVIKLGTNDTKPQNWKHADQFADDLRALIDHFRKLPSKPAIYLCTPAPVARDRWGINEKTVKSELIPLVQKVAKEKKVGVIDIYGALDKHRDLIPDGVHPNAAGEKIMAQTIKAALAKK